MNMATKNPTLWAVLGTMMVSLGGSVAANLLCDQSLTSAAGWLLGVGAVLLMASGAVFYLVYALREHQRYEFEMYLQQKEREFLWDCHDRDIDVRLFGRKYADPNYHISEELVQESRGSIVIPDVVSAKFYGDGKAHVYDKRATVERLLICTGFVLSFVAIVLLLFPNYLRITSGPTRGKGAELSGVRQESSREYKMADGSRKPFVPPPTDW